jgi:hypothetical protein
MKEWIKMVLRPLRQAAGRFVLLPAEKVSYVGRHGCISAAASFTTWNQIEGDYLEFGVYQGESFSAAYSEIMRNRELHRALGFDTPEYRRWAEVRPRFFAFDSFQGLPAGPAERHVDYHPGGYYCTLEDFKARAIANGIDWSDVVTVKGFYDQTLTPELKEKYQLRKAAVVMIDCDLYESTVPVLDFLTDLVHQGTILIFDDWFRFRGSPEHGEQRACREWLARNPHMELIEYWREGPQAVSFLVNMKQGQARLAVSHGQDRAPRHACGGAGDRP